MKCPCWRPGFLMLMFLKAVSGEKGILRSQEIPLNLYGVAKSQKLLTLLPVMVSLYFYIQTRPVHFNTGFMSYYDLISTELWLLTTRCEVIKQYFLYLHCSKKCRFILETDSKTTNTEEVHSIETSKSSWKERAACLWAQCSERCGIRVCTACLTGKRNLWEMEGLRQNHSIIQYQSGRESQWSPDPNFLSKSMV